MTIHSFKPDLPPPTISIGALGWLRANLFSSWINTLLTLVGLYLLWLIVPPVLEWAIFKADWTGDTRADCSREGACWVFVQVRFGQFMYGFYPTELRWRVDAAGNVCSRLLPRAGGRNVLLLRAHLIRLHHPGILVPVHDVAA